MWDVIFSIDNRLQASCKFSKAIALTFQLINFIIVGIYYYGNTIKYTYLGFQFLNIALSFILIGLQRYKFKRSWYKQIIWEILFTAYLVVMAIIYAVLSVVKPDTVDGGKVYEINKSYYFFTIACQLLVLILQIIACIFFYHEQIRFPPFRPGPSILVTASNVTQIRDALYIYSPHDYGDDDNVDLGLPSTSSGNTDSPNLSFGNVKVKFSKGVEKGAAINVDVHCTEQEDCGADSLPVEQSENAGSSPAGQEGDLNVNLIEKENDNLDSSPEQEDKKTESPPIEQEREDAAATPTEGNIPSESLKIDPSAEVHIQEDISSDVINDPPL